MSELGSLQLIFLISTDNILTAKKFKLDLEKAKEPEIKLPTSAGSSNKQESSRKRSTTALLTTPKPLTVGSQQTVENSSKDVNTKPLDLPPENSLCRSGSNR